MGVQVPPPLHQSPTMYQLQLVWNREFHWSDHGYPQGSLDACISAARAAENLGDGASVKETRIVDQNGKVIWQYGKKVETAEEQCLALWGSLPEASPHPDDLFPLERVKSDFASVSSTHNTAEFHTLLGLMDYGIGRPHVRIAGKWKRFDY